RFLARSSLSNPLPRPCRYAMVNGAMKPPSQKTAAGTLRVVEAPRPPEIERLMEDYLAHCRAAGLSPKTIRHAYGYPLRAVFLPWCAEQGIEQPSQLTTRLLDRFVGDLLEHGGKRGA